MIPAMQPVRALPLVALLLLAACDTTAPAVLEAVPFQTLSTGGLFEPIDYRDPDTPAAPPVSVSLTSGAEEAAFLASYPRKRRWLGDGVQRFAPFPDVDYSTSTALVIAQGLSGPGLTIRLDSVVSDGRRTTVYTTHVVRCVLSRYFENPSLVAAVEGVGLDLEVAPPAEERPPCGFGR